MSKEVIGRHTVSEEIQGLKQTSSPSGVGKSSLLNALAPELDMRVGATNESHGKGRHTTRVASLHAVAGGYIADTPGIRELGAWALDPSELGSPHSRGWGGEAWADDIDDGG